MKYFTRRKTRGMTLTEVTLAMMLALGVAATTVVMAGQHVSFMRLLNDFTFLRDDAPTINTLLGRIITKADAYRIYADKSSTFAGAGAVTNGGSALWLRFRNPDGTFQQSAIVFETLSGDTSLNYYNHNGTAWPGTPDWTISSQPSNITFANNTGVLLITMTGPNSEEITYVGNAE